MHKKATALLIILTLIFFIFSCLVAYFIFYTSKGAESIARFVLFYVTQSYDISIGKIEGTLKTKASLYDIDINSPHKLPAGAIVKIQRIDIYLQKFVLRDIVLNIYNGRLNLPFSDPILFYGDCSGRKLNLTLYSKRVNAREIIDLFTRRPVLSTLGGVFSDVNIHIAGTASGLAAEGSFYIENITKEKFSLVNCPGSLLMYCDNLFAAIKLNGEIVLKTGIASGGNTAEIKLEKSKIIFEGDPKQPKLNIRGRAKVAEVLINMTLRGTLAKPELALNSMPVLNQELLLIMLATGRGWSGAQTSLETGAISADLIKDFVDYFLLDGKGNKIARRFGISDISLFYDKQTKGMGLKTSIADKVKVGYEVEPSQSETGTNITKQTVTGELKVTDTISVNAEKEITQPAAGIQQQEKQPKTEEGEEKLYLKFKKQF